MTVAGQMFRAIRVASFGAPEVMEVRGYEAPEYMEEVVELQRSWRWERSRGIWSDRLALRKSEHNQGSREEMRILIVGRNFGK
jgi:hypothetical protein